MVEYIEGKLDWKPSDFFNYFDMNRIESNMQAVVDKIFIEHNKEIVLETIRTDRTVDSIDYFEDANRIERNLEKIRKNWIDGKYMRKGGKQWDINSTFSFEDAITWEFNLYVLYGYAGMAFESYTNKWVSDNTVVEDIENEV